MTDDTRCARCGREVDIDSEEFTRGAATDDGQFICDKCITPEEQVLAEEQLDEAFYEYETWRFDA